MMKRSDYQNMPFSQLDFGEAGREDGLNFPSIFFKIKHGSKTAKIGKTQGDR